MANQPPVRPWFRLASLRAANAPAPALTPAPVPAAPAPVTEPRPSLGQPDQPSEPTRPPAALAPTAASPRPAPAVTATSSVPSSPTTKAVQPPSTSLSAKADTTASARLVSPTQSPKTMKPEAEPRIPEEAERKTVLVQKTVEKPKQWLNGNGESQRELGETRKPREIEAKEKGIQRKHSDSEDMRVITLAGENRGAYMEVFQSPKKHGDKTNYLHKKGHSKTQKNGGESEISSSDEGNVNKKDKGHKGRAMSSFPMTAFMNSNVQCVNNSILYNTSCTHHDPGLRLSLSKKPLGQGFHLKEDVNGQHN